MQDILSASPDSTLKPNSYSPLSLAYLGDCVYEMLVREKIMKTANMPVKKLHQKTVSYVCADSQARALDLILPILSEDEVAVYKRGRNAGGNNVPKNADKSTYHKATGFEALLGYLYLAGNTARILDLFHIIENNHD